MISRLDLRKDKAKSRSLPKKLKISAYTVSSYERKGARRRNEGKDYRVSTFPVIYWGLQTKIPIGGSKPIILKICGSGG